MLARLRALDLLRVIQMTKPKLSDFSFDPEQLRRYELDLSRGIARSDGPEDHARMLEAIGTIAPLYQKAPAPAPSTTATPPLADMKILAVLKKMLALRKNLKRATVLSYTNTVTEFATYLKNPLIQNVGQAQVTRYQDYLVEKENSLRTIDNKIGSLRAFFNFAKQQGYYSAENPAKDRKLLTKKDKLRAGYSIFTEDEIKAIYSCDFLKTQKAKSPDYYWVLVLVLLSGCRVSEITSLTKKQIRIEEKFLVLKITDSKTLAGIREIPIPIEVMAMGFEDFLNSKTDAVFKYMPRPGRGSGNAVGKMFKRHLESVKITDPKLVFHSLRKFTNDYFQKAGVDYEPRCQFFGHEIDSVNVNFYTKRFTPEQLFEYTKAVQISTIKFITTQWKNEK